MPLRRKSYRKSYARRRRPTQSGAGVKALRMVKQLKRKTKPETKFKDYSFTIQDATDTGAVMQFHQSIPIGPDQGHRIGDSITPQRLSGRYVLQLDSESVSNGGSLRIVFVRGKQEDEHGIGPTSILEYAILTSPLSWYNRSHYSVISDRTYSLGYGTNFQKVISFNYKLTGPLRYARNESTTVENGGIYMLMISDSDTISFKGNVRMTYTDV